MFTVVGIKYKYSISCLAPFYMNKIDKNFNCVVYLRDIKVVERGKNLENGVFTMLGELLETI